MHVHNIILTKNIILTRLTFSTFNLLYFIYDIIDFHIQNSHEAFAEEELRYTH